MNEATGKLEDLWTLVGGHRLHARVSVDVPRSPGVPIVLVHGLGASSRYLERLARRLAPMHRVLAPDFPGFGKSDKPRHVLSVPELADVLAAWMQAIGLERAAMFGNSLGCQVIVECASRYPERVGPAILSGPTMDRHARTVHQEFGRWLLNGTREPPDIFPVLVREYRDSGARRMLGTLRLALRDRPEDKLPKLQVPTLVVRGAIDAICSQPWADEVTRLLPRSRLVVLPGAAHIVNFSRADEVAELICDFLETSA